MLKYYRNFLCALLAFRSALLTAWHQIGVGSIMKDNEQRKIDPHLGATSQGNTEKHINFREVEEESAENFAIDKSSSERSKAMAAGNK